MQQQNIYTESLGRFYQNMTKPMVDLAQLNMETFNRVTRNTDYINSFMQAKKPEDFMASQIKFINTAGQEALKYIQTASAILMEAANHGGKAFNEASQEVMQETMKAHTSERPSGKSNFDKK